MIRYIASTMLVFAGFALPVWGASPSAGHASASESSRAGSKSIPTSVPGPAKVAESQNSAKNEVVVTSDLSRAALAARLASRPAVVVPTSVRTATVKPSPESQSALVTRVSPPAAPNRSALSPANVAATTPVRTALSVDEAGTPSGERLGRVTAYWRDEGDYYTGRCISSTGVRLHEGHCAVDPSIIPYGSVVDIQGVGKFLAVDTGSAVISRTAAREGGQTSAERHAIVVDVFFEDQREGERFAAGDAKFVSIRWWTPDSTGAEARAARSLFAEEDWTKIESKQL